MGRLHRSELAVPGSNRRMLEKAPTLGADVVFLDLEDAVAVDEKERARRNVIEALRDLDWSACTVSVRINSLDTPWCYRDIVEVVEGAGHRLDLILVPKVGQPAHLEFVATLLAQIEAARSLPPIGLSALVETAEGMANVEALAASCPGRLEALVFGVADFAASVGARTTRIGAPSPDYAVLTDPDESGTRELHWGDVWHAALARVAVAARAYGLRPVDGPFGDIEDSEGYIAAARRAAALGYEGKWAVHPSQIALANEVFSPPAAQIEEARRILAALEEAAAHGKGAVALDGRLLDAASVRMAQTLVAKADRLEAQRAR